MQPRQPLPRHLRNQLHKHRLSLQHQKNRIQQIALPQQVLSTRPPVLLRRLRAPHPPHDIHKYNTTPAEAASPYHGVAEMGVSERSGTAPHPGAFEMSANPATHGNSYAAELPLTEDPLDVSFVDDVALVGFPRSLEDSSPTVWSSGAGVAWELGLGYR
jgi:hypothetical protein